MFPCHPLLKRSRNNRALPDHCLYKSEAPVSSHAALIPQAVHPEDPSTKQPHLTTWVEAWSNSPSLTSPSNALNGQMIIATRRLTLGTASTVEMTGIGIPDVLVPMWVVNSQDGVWS